MKYRGLVQHSRTFKVQTQCEEMHCCLSNRFSSIDLQYTETNCLFFKNRFTVGSSVSSTMMQWLVSTAASQQEGPEFECLASLLGPFRVDTLNSV